MTQTYKRPTVDDPKEPHPITTVHPVKDHGINTMLPGWMIRAKFSRLFDVCTPLLSAVRDAAQQAKHLPDLDDLKPEIARQRTSQFVGKAIRELHRVIINEQKLAEEAFQTCQQRTLSLTDLPKEIDAPLAIRLMEIRQYLERTNMKPEAIKELIAKDMNDGNFDILHACMGDPFPKVSGAELRVLRRNFAFAQDKSLQQAEYDSESLLRQTRKSCGEINGVVAQILQQHNIPDPIGPSEFYATFEPRNTRERNLAERRILQEQRRADKESRQIQEGE